MIDREQRQRLIESYARDNGGKFDPAGFVLQVREQGRNHPAYEWFQWDDNAAAEQWRVEQARRFATGLKVIFEVKAVGGKSVRVKAPAILSPVEDRSEGGGYYVTDLKQEDHLAELRKQALRDLKSWAHRYEAVLVASGANIGALTLAIEGKKAA